MSTAFVLHTRPWRETSLLLDVLTQDHGLLRVLAKGAKRPTSALRGLLEPFQPIKVQLSGRGELKQLSKAYWLGGLQPALPAKAMMHGWYLSELCLRCLAPEDACPQTFAAYHTALVTLAQGQDATQALRAFEISLLREMGLMPDCMVAGDGAAITAAATYQLDLSYGWRSVDDNLQQGEIIASGAVLLAIGQENLASLDTQQAEQLKRVMRKLVELALQHKPLLTRQTWAELAQFKPLS